VNLTLPQRKTTAKRKIRKMIDEVKENFPEENENEEQDTSSPADGAPAEERVVIFEEALEAILFAAGHPISYATLARVFEMTPGKVKDKVFEYSLKYNDPAIPRGVILLTYGDSCQLCTKQYYLNEIRDALGIKKSGSLSTSSMEALAIVAYNQPVTRIFVDTLRRADSSYAMNNLLDRGLIEAQGRLDAPGRPMLYGTTPDFLRVFGLKNLSELPGTSEEITDMFAKGKNVEDEEEAVQEEMVFPEADANGANGDTDATDDEKSDIASDEYEHEPSAEDIFYADENADTIEDGESNESTDKNDELDEFIDDENEGEDDEYYEEVSEDDESDTVPEIDDEYEDEPFADTDEEIE
jgi:segregation and condensation protein B